MSNVRWRLKPDPRFGPAATIIEGFVSFEATDAEAFPDFSGARTLALGTDFSGHHKGSRYESYGFLLVDRDGMEAWLAERRSVRARYLPDGRRLSYKNLNDAKRRAALPDFLEASNRLPGLLIVFAVDRRIPTLFDNREDPAHWEPALQPLQHWHTGTRERLMMVCHLGGMIAAGLSYPEQNLQWVTDQDDIVANREQAEVVMRAFAHISGYFMPHTMGQFRVASTAADTGRRDLEDFVTIADLAAGGVCSVLNTYQGSGLRVGLETVPSPHNLKSKDRLLMDWLSRGGQPLKRLFVAFEHAPLPQPFLVRRYMMVAAATPPVGSETEVEM